jgi:hypothetical protein
MVPVLIKAGGNLYMGGKSASTQPKAKGDVADSATGATK